MIQTGTSHFVSRQSAMAYYRNQGYQSGAAAVDEKLKEEAIAIGPPKLKPGQKCRVNDEGRYIILN